MQLQTVDTSGLCDIQAWLDLSGRVQKSQDLDELLFVIVNISRSVCAYRTAVLVERNGSGGKVRAISGVAVVDRNAPFANWLEKVAACLLAGSASKQVGVVDPEQLPETLRQDWGIWMAAQVVWVPLALPGKDEVRGGLVLMREMPPWGAEFLLLSHLQGLYTPALLIHSRRFGRGILPVLVPDKRRALALRAGLLVGLVVVLLLPVRINIVAPAEVVPEDPVVVRAPLTGVVATLEVKPNERVVEGQLLMSLDKEDLNNRLDIARQSYGVAVVQLEQDKKKAMLGERERFNLGVLERVLERHVAEISHLEALLMRADIVSPAAGVVIIQDALEWDGRPVRLGERIMMIADPARSALEVQVPVGDMILIPSQAEVLFYLNIAPEKPIPAQVERISYQAGQTESGTLAYHVRAKPQGGVPVRIGLKGLAKIYGREATLIGYLLRRPIAYVRQQFEILRL